MEESDGGVSPAGISCAGGDAERVICVFSTLSGGGPESSACKSAAELSDLSREWPDRPAVSGRFGVDAAASKSGGGGPKSCLEVDAANAMASAPYGMPNLANASLDDISFNCSGVGPDLG